MQSSGNIIVSQCSPKEKKKTEFLLNFPETFASHGKDFSLS